VNYVKKKAKKILVLQGDIVLRGLVVRGGSPSNWGGEGHNLLGWFQASGPRAQSPSSADWEASALPRAALGAEDGAVPGRCHLGGVGAS